MDNENAKRPTTKRLPNDEIGEFKKLFKESQGRIRNLQRKIEENETRY